MASLFDNVVDRTKVWRGAARIVYAPSGTSFPGKLESVIQPAVPADPDATAYALAAAWSDLGGTNKSGVTVTRSFEGKAGVEVDQLTYDLFEGDPEKWDMEVKTELVHTDTATLAVAWELPASASIGADTTGPDYSVAQVKQDLSAPTSLTERLLAVIQQHPTTNNLRVLVFRKAKIAPESMDTVISSGDGSTVPVTFNLDADTTIDSDEDPFGVVFEETTN
jgi:hypothetical protein